MCKELPFYPCHRLYKLLRVSVTSGLREEHVVSDGSRAVRLDHASRTLADLNETVPLTLDEHTILDYLHFFFAFSRGRHGRFFLVECVDDLRLPAATDAATRNALAALIRPLRVSRSTEPEGPAFEADCTFFFNGALFACPVRIALTGGVQMGDEVLLRSDLEATAVDHVT
jgi:hypothetical protein